MQYETFWYLFSNKIFICLGCIENTNWQTTTGYKCADYAINKWCENGEIGSAWDPNWGWSTDANGLDAQSACCICGRNKGEKYNLRVFLFIRLCLIVTLIYLISQYLFYHCSMHRRSRLSFCNLLQRWCLLSFRYSEKKWF